MAYNTRRKSISLPSLGINLPVTHAARAAAKSHPSIDEPQMTTRRAKRSHDDEELSRKRSHDELSRKRSHDEPSRKRSHDEPSRKRSHDDAKDELSSPSRMAAKKMKFVNHSTPPPSPTHDADKVEVEREIDMDAIQDDIVEAVILRLRSTGNRPHLVKQLAEILHDSVKIVGQ
jgi:hypothetical protein